MMRSIPLRGFDQQMANQIKTYMEEGGIPFIKGVPVSVELAPSGRKLVKYSGAEPGMDAEEEFDTVLLATGRDVCTSSMGLEATGVAVNAKNGKIPTVNEQTNVPHIYAIADEQMDYLGVPTTVYTPLEY